MLCSKKSRTETLPSREFNRKIVKIEKKKQQQTRHVHGAPLKGNQAGKAESEHLF